MNINDLNTYILNIKNVTKRKMDEDERWIDYLVFDRVFAVIHKTKENRIALTVKNIKSKLNELRIKNQNKIVPALEFEPLHWNSIYLDTDIPDDVIKKTIMDSYNLIYCDFNPILKKIYKEELEDQKYVLKTKKNSNEFLKFQLEENILDRNETK